MTSWLALFGANALCILVLMTALWLVSLIKKDVSIVDPWWSIAFLLVTARTVAATGLAPAKLFVLGLTTVWALRLWLHLLLRARGKSEDPRYAAFRQRYGPTRYWWISFFQVFLLQAMLASFISAPLQVLAASGGAIGWPVLFGAIVFAVGFLYEAIADRQLQRFRDDPSKRGQVMDSGLWGYSRHPNYFGEAVLWWGFWLCSLAVPSGWLTLPAPLLMTFLLARVSGVTMLDEHMLKTKPAYADYLRRTPALIPRPPGRSPTR